MPDALLLLLVLIGLISLFIANLWRFDIVASLALLLLVVAGIVPAKLAFSGFSNPAVVTVACVMILTQAITASGLMDNLLKHLMPSKSHISVDISILCFVTALLSAFMNNVGALALMMPVALSAASKKQHSAALYLMPLAFASVLGGLCTAIGTPPNLLISAYRQEVTGNAFAMFDFSMVGISVALVTISFITIVGWRLLPHERKGNKRSEDLFHIKDYISEVKIAADSVFVDKTLKEIEEMLDAEINILGLIRQKKKRTMLNGSDTLQGGDIVLLEATPDDLQTFIQKGKCDVASGSLTADSLLSENIGVIEVVVPQGSRLEGRSWQGVRIRSRFHINLLAISRQGKAFRQRLNHVNLRAGDVLLLQGEVDNTLENITTLGLLPLVERNVQVSKKSQRSLPAIIFLIAISLAGFQWLPVSIAFALAVVALVVAKITSARKLYEPIDGSIIVLLAVMIPIGNALQTTGATQLIADTVVSLSQYTSTTVILGLLMLVTMTLSDVMNNAATAVVMSPIAVTIAQRLQLAIDPFLMTVAVGASCSFLTPISHQNNTLVMGPGGYKFTDYLRLGLPVELLVLLVGLPMILLVWPLR